MLDSKIVVPYSGSPTDMMGKLTSASVSPKKQELEIVRVVCIGCSGQQELPVAQISLHGDGGMVLRSLSPGGCNVFL